MAISDWSTTATENVTIDDYTIGDGLGSDAHTRAIQSIMAAVTGEVALTAGDETITGAWTFTGTLNVDDDALFIRDNADVTKKVAFQASGITTGTTRTFTFPDYDATFATIAGTETLTNKTLTSPTINGATVSGTFAAAGGLIFTGGTIAMQGGTASLGVLDTTRGIFQIFGNATGETSGGEIRIHNSADHDGTTEYWGVMAKNGAFEINNAGGTAALSISTGNVLTTSGGLVASSGTLNVGVADTTRGTVRVYGPASAALGGNLILENAGNWDSTYNSFQLAAYQDDFILRVNETTEIFNIDGTGIITTAERIRPGTDNAYTCGTAIARWSDVYAASGSVNTSDKREKQDFATLPKDMLAAGWAAARSVGTYRWKDRVTVKGDKARMHIGLVAQDAIALIGDDAMRFGAFCYDEWGADEAKGTAAGSRYGLRPDQTNAWMIAGVAHVVDDLAARIAALGARLAELEEAKPPEK